MENRQIAEIFWKAGMHPEYRAALENGSRFQMSSSSIAHAARTYGDYYRTYTYNVLEAREDGMVYAVAMSRNKEEAEQILETLRASGTYTPPAVKCWKCKGTGQFRSYGKCFACNGTGRTN